MDKSPEAFRTISEVSEMLETQAHVLRFWEMRFKQLRPMQRGGGRRYYSPSDIALLRGIKHLLHVEKKSIRDAQMLLDKKGAAYFLQEENCALWTEESIQRQPAEIIQIHTGKELIGHRLRTRFLNQPPTESEKIVLNDALIRAKNLYQIMKNTDPC